jgi:hypothetical protein
MPHRHNLYPVTDLYLAVSSRLAVEHMSCKSHVHIIIVMMTRDPIL